VGAQSNFLKNALPPSQLPHFQPIFLKLKTKKDIRNTTHTQNLVNVRRRKEGLWK